MVAVRNTLPTQHLLIDENLLEEMILANQDDTALTADEKIAAAVKEIVKAVLEAKPHSGPDLPADAAPADGSLPVTEMPGDVLPGEEVATPSGSGLRIVDQDELQAFADIADLVIVSTPLEALPAADLPDPAGNDGLQNFTSLSTTFDQAFLAPDPGVTELDYVPLAKPDNPGGGGGKGGGGNGGGKGGGKPDKGGDGGDGGDGGTDPGTGVVDSYTSGPDGGYNVQIDFLGTWTEALQQAFIDAADLISSLITADVVDITYNGTFYDDIIITAELATIDGPGGILGQAGPTLIRTGSGQPIAAIMEFDSADAANYNDAGLWNDIVLHEMLHSIGVGTIWNYAGLLDGYGTSNPLFNGEFANLAYDELFADLNLNQSDLIPVEGDGGSGTAYGHWDDATFGNELMTGYINGSNYVSAMTVASLEDLGYETTWDASAPGDTGIGTIVV